MTLTKINRNLVNETILKTFRAGARTDKEISDAVNNLNVTYKCPACKKYHHYKIKPTTVIWKLQKLGLIGDKEFKVFLIARDKSYKRKRARASYNAKKNMDPNAVCNKCGSNDRLEPHHIIPVYMGGTDEKENLEVLCHNCHSKLHGTAKNPIPWEIRKFGMGIGSQMIEDLKHFQEIIDECDEY